VCGSVVLSVLREVWGGGWFGIQLCIGDHPRSEVWSMPAINYVDFRHTLPDSRLFREESDARRGTFVRLVFALPNRRELYVFDEEG